MRREPPLFNLLATHDNTCKGNAPALRKSSIMPVFVAFDLETTGLSPQTDRIVEIGAIQFDESGADLGTFQSLVNPLRSVNPHARAIHGISDEELADAPLASEVLPQFLSWLNESPGSFLLAHNASFDAAFLGAALARLGLLGDRPLEIVDTLPLTRKRLSELPNHRLETVAAWHNLDLGGAHRALADSLRVKGIWLALTGGIVPEDTVAYPVSALSIAPPVPSGWDELICAIALSQRLRITYEGGSLGPAPREITPRRFRHMGGVAYIVAECHNSATEKTFRLDRMKIL